MKSIDLTSFIGSSLKAVPVRSVLSGLGIAIGITAVTLLTAIGQGLHQYILDEFTQFGTNLIGINPGRATTMGMPGGVINSVHPLTLEDAQALASISGVDASMPMVQGNAEVEAGRNGRRANIFGVNADMPIVFKIGMSAGQFLPSDDLNHPRAFAVLGYKMAKELFPDRSSIGQLVRLGGNRFRVVGVAEEKGVMLGFDLDDTAYIPAAKAQELFNKEGVMEIDLHYLAGYPTEAIVEQAKQILIARHGREDFTITTQDQMLEVLGTILDVVTWSVAALGGISLFVGAIGILTIMTIAVQERTSEIGLLRAIGASRGQITAIFIGEAAILSSLGGLAGLSAGFILVSLSTVLLPGFPLHIPWLYAVATLFMTAVIGLVTGVTPALHAANIDPIEALRNE